MDEGEHDAGVLALEPSGMSVAPAGEATALVHWDALRSGPGVGAEGAQDLGGAAGPPFLVRVRPAERLRRVPAMRVGAAAVPVDGAFWTSLGLQGIDRPARLTGSQFLAGHRLHSTHQLWRKGVYTFCGQCGSWATGRALQLLEACDLVFQKPKGLKTAQRDALSRLRKGNPPRQGASSWGVRADAVLLEVG